MHRTDQTRALIARALELLREDPALTDDQVALTLNDRNKRRVAKVMKITREILSGAADETRVLRPPASTARLIRLTADEDRALREKATGAGMDVSSYLRMVALDE